AGAHGAETNETDWHDAPPLVVAAATAVATTAATVAESRVERRHRGIERCEAAEVEMAEIEAAGIEAAMLERDGAGDEIRSALSPQGIAQSLAMRQHARRQQHQRAGRGRDLGGPRRIGLHQRWDGLGLCEPRSDPCRLGLTRL